MRILLIASEPASLANFRGPLIKTLVDLGHHVFAAAPALSEEQIADIKELGADTVDVPLQRTGMNPSKDFKFLFAVWRCIRTLKPDLVITYTIKPNIWGGIAAGLGRVASVSMVTGLGFVFTQTEGHSKKTAVLRAIISRLFRISTGFNRRVIFQNPDDRDEFIAAGCLADPGKARLVNGSGVDMAHYARKPLPDAPVFLMTARLLKNKGVKEYSLAAAALKKLNPDVRCLLVGGFDPGPDSISQAELDNWIAGGVEYLGAQSDVRDTLAEASIFVLPSYREGTPRSVLEAMSMGRPIITCDVPGCRETVKDGVNGYLCPVRDSDAILSAMIRLSDSPETRTKMGQASYDLACEKYDVHTLNSVLLTHFELE